MDNLLKHLKNKNQSYPKDIFLLDHLNAYLIPVISAYNILFGTKQITGEGYYQPLKYTEVYSFASTFYSLNKSDMVELIDVLLAVDSELTQYINKKNSDNDRNKNRNKPKRA